MDSPVTVTRRGLLTSALAGTAIAALPIRAFDRDAAAAPASVGVFGYGVASGDPTLDSVIIWTRATPAAGVGPGDDGGTGLSVLWEVAADSAFANVVAFGTVPTSHNGDPTAKVPGDYTVKVDVTGLSSYTRYYYRFTAGGEVSRVGRTQTVPDDGDVKAMRFALVTCSNYTGGYFSAYRVIGQRDDLDFVLHVGDYIYEYGNGSDRYGPASLTGVRDGIPADDTITLQDYRLRHALHKADPDCALAHQQTPWITIFDDHEVCNNTWATGAENQHPTTPGGPGGMPAPRPEPAFATRRASAYQAYLEWMPFRYPVQPSQQVPHQGQQFFRTFKYGQLADLSVLETRQNRSAQIDSDGTSGKGGGFVAQGTVATADAATPGRHMPEPEQVTWLTGKVNAKGRPWHLVGNQVMFTPVRYPGSAVGVTGSAIAVNSDQWDGYPANQTQVINLLNAAPAAAGDSVFLTGDIHSSWACDIPIDQSTYVAATPGNSAGVEFVTPSVTSDGFYEVVRGALGASAPVPTVLATTQGLTAAVQAQTPWVQYLDGISHGFTVIDVTPARVQADYYLTPQPSTAQPEPRAVQSVVPGYAKSYQTVAGTRKISAASGPVGARSDIPADASQPVSALPEHVGPAAVAGVLAAGAFVAYSRRRNALTPAVAED